MRLVSLKRLLISGHKVFHSYFNNCFSRYLTSTSSTKKKRGEIPKKKKKLIAILQDVIPAMDYAVAPSHCMLDNPHFQTIMPLQNSTRTNEHSLWGRVSKRLCVCVCVCVCMCLCLVCVHACMHMCVCGCGCMCVCVCVCL